MTAQNIAPRNENGDSVERATTHQAKKNAVSPRSASMTEMIVAA